MKNYFYKLSIVTVFLSALALSSCKSSATPIVYDKTQSTLDNEKELITLLLNTGRLEEALKKIEYNLSVYKENIELNTLKVYYLVASAQLREAELLSETLLQRNKNNPLLYAALSKIYRQKKEYSKAETYIKSALSITQSIAYVWFEKGILEYIQKNYKAAELSFNKAYMIDRNYREAFFFRYLCRIYNKKNINEIKDQWETFLSTTEKNSYYFTYHANALYENDLTDDAGAIVTEGLSLFPEDPYLLNFSAFIKLKKWEVTRDEKLLTEAKDQIEKTNIYITTPETADTHLLYLKLSGDNLLLQSEFEKYFLMFPDSKIILDWRNVVYDKK